jgi:hypothetical protein
MTQDDSNGSEDSLSSLEMIWKWLNVGTVPMHNNLNVGNPTTSFYFILGPKKVAANSMYTFSKGIEF